MAGDGGAERGVALADVGAYAASVTITEGLAPGTGVRSGGLTTGVTGWSPGREG
ncbi:MAG: hypothetical protein U0Q08_08420 [Dermatophilaceae bacterium]|jgi:hypothetical protein